MSWNNISTKEHSVLDQRSPTTFPLPLGYVGKVPVFQNFELVTEKGSHIFQKSGGNLQTLGAKTVTRSKFHIVDPQF